MNSSPVAGTIIIYGPHYQRSGFGLLARGWAFALHLAGASVRIVPVDCNDPTIAGDLDDCDLYLLRSLQYTPIEGPVTAIYAYVPTYYWTKMPLPEPHVRIMLTTFDSTAKAVNPPNRLIYMCNRMDQVWVTNEAEQKAWLRGGIDPHRIRYFNWPHSWLDSTVLPPIKTDKQRTGPFRFLHISLLLPRRRLDVLLRAFFEEFRGSDEAELVLKMTYPTWHPIGGKPQRDMREMIEKARKAAGSNASVVLDESLGTRLGLVKLIDSCDAYVSPDTTNTAPVSEAIFRHLPVIITDGWGIDLPPQAVVVPNSKEMIPITPEMAEYMPHQRGAEFPALDVGLMREALRRVFNLRGAERQLHLEAAVKHMRDRFSAAATTPFAIKAIGEAWAARNKVIDLTPSKPIAQVEVSADSAASKKSSPLFIHWGGLQLFHGKIPKFNREISLELMRRGHQLTLSPGNGPFHIEEFDLLQNPKFLELAERFHHPFSRAVDINVCSRWHPIFNEQPAARQILANPWWSGSIPVDWIRPINESVSEIWVPSNFVRENFIAGGIEANRVCVVPMGVDPEVFHPKAAPYPLKTRKGFKFLFVGETSPRRGFDTLLGAYVGTFSRKDDVCLVVKDMDCEDYYAKLGLRRVVEECRKNPLSPEIEYITTMLPDADLAGLYTACDCFVQPHRTASSGLAVMEAMACDLPVIATNFGGVKDFATSETAYLIPGKTVCQRPAKIGHWNVAGDQLHAEVDKKALAERMSHVVRHAGESRRFGALSGHHIRENFTWKKSADIVLGRMETVLANEDRRTKPVRLAEADNSALSVRTDGPTVVVYAPFYNRSGYGVAARSLVSAWRSAGVKIRIVPVDNVEEGVDDCDMEWIRSLEKTPVTTPVIAVFFHIASPAWVQVSLPPGSLRILYTTFDGTAQGLKPPADWVAVCNKMDQLWLQTEKEADVFVAAGVPRGKIHALRPPHPWIHNRSLPAPTPKASGAKFRFMSIAMFQPRRRWDTLIEAFLTEFKDTPDVELYLKVNYPSWHPEPGQPPKDLRRLIETLREKTGSNTSIILDEDLGTRTDICRLIDNCDAYASTDTTLTAPVGEAFVRGKITVIPDGYGAALPYCEGALVIPVDPKLSRPMTEEMLKYQPHHRGREMPLLRTDDVRRALRSAYALPLDQRREMGRVSALIMECCYGPAVVTPEFILAMNKALKDSRSPAASGVEVNWEGSFLDYGSLSFVNRALTGALVKLPHTKVNRVGNPTLSGSAAESTELQALAKQLHAKSPHDAKITVRHQWPPDWSRPKEGSLVVMQPWEFGTLPEDWVKKSEQVDEFWAYTNYVRQVYISSGVDASKVKVVPLGIDPAAFRPDVRPFALATTKRFKFLFVGGTIGRKGPDVLLKAYLANFTATDDVCLVIKDFGGKSVYAGQTLEPQIKAIKANLNAPEICYLNEELPAEALPALYNACDSLVHPYRGEGFGLPVLEAMACGLPVIVTAGGSTDDFATDAFSYHIPARRQSIGNNVSGMKLAGDGWMLEPDAVALGERMKWVVAHRDDARALGQRASVHARTQWSWDRAAGIAQERIEAITAQQKTSASKTMPPNVARKAAPKALPAVAKLGDLSHADELFRKKSPRAAWESAIEAIRMRPHHPEAFLLLAEIARMVGDSTSARACAQHALSLAPAFKPAKKFLKGSFHGNTKPEWLTLPPSIERRANKIKPTLSVCLIVKNEERFIRQCLASVKELADQIVVVDTGSTDATVAIAKEFGAEIHEFKWCDDFSTARNAALQHVTGEWVLSFDADEELPVENRAAFLKLLENESVISWRLPLFDIGRENEGCNYVPRLFRNAPGLHFVGRVHEQVFYSVEARRVEWGLENRIGDAALRHYGYTKELIKERSKVDRNLRLLERAIEEIPDDPLLFMNYGLELSRSDRVEEGLAQYKIAFEKMSQQPASTVTPETREAMLTQYCTYLRIGKRQADVAKILTSPLARSGELTATQHFLSGLAHIELKDFPAAAQQMRHCLAKRNLPTFTPINPDIRTVIPQHSIAICLWQMKDVEGTHQAFQAGIAEAPAAMKLHIDYARFLHENGKTPDALQLLNGFVSANPQAAEAWLAGAQITLSHPSLFEVALDWTDVACQQHPQDSKLLAARAEALLLVGHLEPALDVWTKLDPASQPDSAAAVILCETALGTNTHRPTAMLRPAVQEKFMKWYWRLVETGAEATVLKLLERADALAEILPDAGAKLQAMVKELNLSATH
ncbi:MAG TPA: glycosyltransferase [Lacunisphaera sp.]|jgi:glycosyltransferase involved in cell wall biosynthesis